MKNYLLLTIVLIFFSLNLYAELNVLCLSGSCQENSLNKKLLEEAAVLLKELNTKVTVIDLKELSLPFYDQNREAQSGMPESVKRLRDQMIQSQAILIASPEYNSSVTAILKNAIDWASRNEQGKPSREAFKEKKFLLLCASSGQNGGTKSLQHLRLILEDLGGHVLKEQFILLKAYEAFDPEGRLKDVKTKSQLTHLIKTLMNLP